MPLEYVENTNKLISVIKFCFSTTVRVLKRFPTFDDYAVVFFSFFLLFELFPQFYPNYLFGLVIKNYFILGII